MDYCLPYRSLMVLPFLLSFASCTSSTQVAKDVEANKDVAAVANYDDLNKQLAVRVRQALNIPESGSTTEVLVTTTESGIGSLYRTGGRWIAMDDLAPV